MSLENRMPVASHRGRRRGRVDENHPGHAHSSHANWIETDGKGHSNGRKCERFHNDPKGLQQYLNRRQRHRAAAEAAAATAAAEEAERPIEE